MSPALGAGRRVFDSPIMDQNREQKEAATIDIRALESAAVRLFSRVEIPHHFLGV